ncbi:MAG: helix-turn-helix transcriptional regulator [Actinomycetota bacterium]
MRRIERLINLIIALLETRTPMSAEQIRRKVAGYDEQPTDDAFRRAFERDKESLRDMGIPLEVRKADPLDEHSDGYLIPKERYYLPDLELEPDELAALRLAVESASQAPAASAGFMKISVDQYNAPLEGPRVVWGADMAADEPRLAGLYEAQLDRRSVRFTYERPTGEVSVRTVEPYGLVNRRGHWYLVGRDADRDAQRSFRVSRIKGGIETLDERYQVPSGVDPRAALPAEGFEIGDEPVEAVVRFDPATSWWAEQNMAGSPRTEAPGGALDVTLPVANLGALVNWVLGFGSSVTILSPEAARARLLEHLAPYSGKARG